MRPQSAALTNPTDEDALAQDAAALDAPVPDSSRPDWTSVCLQSLWSRPGGASGRPSVGHIVSTLEREVIPRLARARRSAAPAAAPLSASPTPADLQSFVARLLDGDGSVALGIVEMLRRRGMSVEALFLELLAPSACCLGALWDEDLCDFPGVTVGLGRLQRLLRELSTDFMPERPASMPVRRVLLTQPPQEQHSFGLSMVAEFFRRDGWIVDGGVGSAAVDPAARVQTEWFDAVGFSIGSQQRLGWLRERVAAVRGCSRNPQLVVLVGGPLFTVHPDWVAQVGADGSAPDAHEAPRLAGRLVAMAVAAGRLGPPP